MLLNHAFPVELILIILTRASGYLQSYASTYPVNLTSYRTLRICPNGRPRRILKVKPMAARGER